MSGEANQGDPPAAPEKSEDAGVIPVEVDAPEPATAPVAVAAPAEPAPAEPAPPAANGDRTAELEARIATLEKEKKDGFDRYLRAAADLENARKRQKRELEDAKLETKGKVLKEMLPVVDNLERAIEHAASQTTEGQEKNPIVEGVQLVLRQFVTAFERLDVTSVDALDQPFDPNMHEAISQQESDKPPGTVVQVLQRGYKSGDRLMRPSLVVVAKAKSE
jgi:molecular chaperone GrpE